MHGGEISDLTQVYLVSKARDSGSVLSFLITVPLRGIETRDLCVRGSDTAAAPKRYSENIRL